jgi:hypothetical protein
VQRSGALEYLASIINGQSQMLAFQDTYIIVAGVALAAMLPAWLLSQSQKQPKVAFAT